jgi:hypothetical protein
VGGGTDRRVPPVRVSERIADRSGCDARDPHRARRTIERIGRTSWEVGLG